MPAASDQLRSQAFQARRDNRPEDARHDLVDAAELCRKSGDQIGLARCLEGLGHVETDLQHGDAALRHYENAVAIYRAEGNLLGLAHAVRHLGDVHRNQGHARLAEPCYNEALGVYRSHQETSSLDLANTIRGMALLKSEAIDIDVDIEHAKLLWEEARSLYMAVGVEAGVAESSRRLAALERSCS